MNFSSFILRLNENLTWLRLEPSVKRPKACPPPRSRKAFKGIRWVIREVLCPGFFLDLQIFDGPWLDIEAFNISDSAFVISGDVVEDKRESHNSLRMIRDIVQEEGVWVQEFSRLMTVQCGISGSRPLASHSFLVIFADNDFIVALGPS